MRHLAFASTLLLLGTSACKKGDEANCGAVSGHVAELLRAELAKDSDPDRVKRARANLPTLQNSLLETCEAQKWTKSVRLCITKAQTAADLEACDPALAPGATPTAESAASTE